MSEENTFGGWLKQRRKELSITQEELAERIGISWITLRKLEAGDRRPSGQLAVLLAEFLQIPADEHEAFVAFARTGRTASGEVSPTSPWRNVSYRATNLPALLTPLIGREQDVAAIRSQLLNPKTRLLTLTGAPGIGKTRLALQSAQELLAEFEDGVFFVDLAPVTDPDLVIKAIAYTLGLKEAGQASLERLMLDYLKQMRTLLVLDNFEQVLDASIEVVKLLEASPLLKVLITSREALQVRGERRFFVPPLAVPDLKQLTGLEELADYPSVELFLERAQAVAPDFALGEANAQDVAAICVGLEGLPLAIELAASRANRLSPAEMRSALTNRLKLLRVETRDLPIRQRTLKGAIGWSYDLLDDNARRLLRHLGVFVGGFTREAVEAVCATGGAAEPPSVDTLYALVDRNLVRQSNLSGGNKKETATDSSQSRFGMWEAIREFALDELRVYGERADADQAHALYYAGLAHEAAPHFTGTDQKKWLDRLDQEHDNLRAALRWAWETSESRVERAESDNREKIDAAELGLEMAVDLLEYWNIRCFYSEGREELKRLRLAGEKLGCSREIRLRALNAEGRLARVHGDTFAAGPILEQALALGRELGNKQSVANSLNDLGAVANASENFFAARSLYQESLALRRELGDRRGIAQSLNNLGLIAQALMDTTLAHEYHSESLAIRQELGDKRGMSQSLNHLGFMAYREAEYVRARELFEQSLSICLELGDKWGISFSYNNLGLVALMQDELETAIAYHERSLAIRYEIGDNRQVCYSLINIAVALFAQGNYEKARENYAKAEIMGRALAQKAIVSYAHYHLGNVAYMENDHAKARTIYLEALEMGQELETPVLGPAIWCIYGLGAVAAESGAAKIGAMLIGAATSAIEVEKLVLDPEDKIVFERGTTAARARLRQDDFQSAWAEGQKMSLQEAIDYVLETSKVTT